MSEEISSPVRAFVAAHIHSVAQLELILLLAREPERHWTAAEAARIFALSPDMTRQLLSELGNHGLVAAASKGETTYCYAPRTTDFDQIVQQLASLYQERRVTLIQLIYAPPLDKLQSFADAFDLRKKKEDD